jgi:hypothetical protein
MDKKFVIGEGLRGSVTRVWEKDRILGESFASRWAKEGTVRHENEHTRNRQAIAESLPFNYNAPFNPEFLGAQRPRLGEDY